MYTPVNPSFTVLSGLLRRSKFCRYIFVMLSTGNIRSQHYTYFMRCTFLGYCMLLRLGRLQSKPKLQTELIGECLFTDEITNDTSTELRYKITKIIFNLFVSSTTSPLITGASRKTLHSTLHPICNFRVKN